MVRYVQLWVTVNFCVLQTVMEIYDFEKPFGIILSFGGQLPNNIAKDLHLENVNIPASVVYIFGWATDCGTCLWESRQLS